MEMITLAGRLGIGVKWWERFHVNYYFLGWINTLLVNDP